MKLAFELKEGRFKGVWSTVDKGDVHVYVNENAGVVIGTNVDHNDQIEYSDLALVCYPPDGRVPSGVSLQFVGKDGAAAHASVTEEVWREEILKMLKGIRARVVEEFKVK